MSEPRVVVVGGGVVGLACAWELRRLGADVVVLERAGVGGGVSRGNTGWVSPSLTYPLPGPGMVREGLRQLVTGGDAFVLRPSLDPAFVRWLWGFRRNCSSARFDAGIRARLGLNRRTLELFDAYRDAGVAFEMHTAGLVVAACTPGGLDLYRRTFQRLRELGYEGGSIDELDGGARPSSRPHSTGLGLSSVCTTGGPLRPPGTADRGPSRAPAGRRSRNPRRRELRTLARTTGGWALETNSGPVAAHRLVVAAGLPTAPLLRRLGVRVPLIGARGYSVTLAGRGTPPRHALYLAEAKLGLSPFDGVVRVAGVFELGARNEDVSPAVGERLLAAARPYLGGWQPDPDGQVEAWAGLRPATPDGLPLIGALPGLDGIYLATGHGMLGVILAPATANRLARPRSKDAPAPELAPFVPPESHERVPATPAN